MTPAAEQADASAPRVHGGSRVDALIDTLLPALAWHPEALTATPLLAHLPALVWLACVLQPAQAVTLGDATGLALAAQRAGAGGGGRFHAEGAGPEALDAAARYGPGEVDLLVIAEPLPDPLQADLLDAWLPRMSARGVMVLPGRLAAAETAPYDSKLPAANPISAWPRLGLAQAGGSLAVMPGQTPPPLLAWLAGANPESPERAFLEGVLSALGARLADRLAAQTAAATADALRAEQAEATARLIRRDAALAAMAQQLDAARRARDAVAPELARQARELERLSRRLIDDSPDAAELRMQVAALKDQIAELRASTSWKATAPLRALGRWLGRG